MKTLTVIAIVTTIGLTLSCGSQDATAEKAKSSDQVKGKPNILVIWGDDIGQSNISTYTHGDDCVV